MCRIDSTIVRLVFIFIALLTAIIPVFLVYLVGCLIVPLESKNLPAFEIKKFYRSKNNKIFAGICAGLSKRIRVDVTIIRIVLIIVSLITGIFPLLLSYVIGWIIIPEEP